jgi:signal transduction histidine kinase
VTPRWLVIPAGIVLGLLAETGWPPGVDTRIVLADLAIGWLFIGSGYVVWRSRPASRVGVLLILTGTGWFAATFYRPAEFLYCGPLIHLLATHPTGRLRGRMSRHVVAAGYVLSAAGIVRTLDPIGIAIGVVIIGIGIAGQVERLAGRGRSRAVIDVLSVALGAVLGGGSLARVLGSPLDVSALVAYEVLLAATAVTIVTEVVWRVSSPTGLARFVVDLGGAADAGTLRDRLARAVGDSSLTLGYAVAGVPNAWVDDAGAPVERPARTLDRTVTPIAANGVELGFVAHDRASVGDPRIVGLIAAAAGLAISNSATQAEIRRSLAKVDASRERLVHAADAQGRRIESTLEHGVDARLARVAELLGLAANVRPGDSQLVAVIDELRAARDRLRDFSRGVYPASLSSGGLATALEELGSRSPVPVETELVRNRYDPAIESTLYFVCSEALANVAKHARATRIGVQLSEAADGLVLRVGDDGVGGASVSAGTGLRGLADRVEALGGSLVVDGRSGLGTAVTAVVPLRGNVERLPRAVA